MNTNTQESEQDIFYYIWNDMSDIDKSYFYHDYQSFCLFFENIGQKMLIDLNNQFPIKS